MLSSHLLVERDLSVWGLNSWQSLLYACWTDVHAMETENLAQIIPYCDWLSCSVNIQDISLSTSYTLYVEGNQNYWSSNGAFIKIMLALDCPSIDCRNKNTLDLFLSNRPMPINHELFIGVCTRRKMYLWNLIWMVYRASWLLRIFSLKSQPSMTPWITSVPDADNLWTA